MGVFCVSRAPEEEDRGTFSGVQDSQEVCTTSFSTSPPSQVGNTPLLVKSSLICVGVLFNFWPFLLVLFLSYLFFYCLYLMLPQCVCTLSPSPSKQSKPTPLDSLQLPLAPGFVTHAVSLCRPLTASFIHSRGFCSFWRKWAYLSCGFHISLTILEVMPLLCKYASNKYKNTEPGRHFQKLYQYKNRLHRCLLLIATKAATDHVEKVFIF